ncbi:MAG TPA: hypothetical protein VD772_01735, partial [Anseongella sp.]|nr:hypothetical protein [Anseongella sp.]
FFYRSNTKNLVLLKAYFLEKKYSGSGKGILIGGFLFLLALFAGLVYLISLIISWFFRAFPEVYNWFMELLK